MSPQTPGSKTRGGPAARRRGGTSYRRAGILAILGMVVITYGVFTKRVPFVPHYHISGVFSTSNQIIKGSPVRIAGVDVGQVSKIANGPGSTTIVRTCELVIGGEPSSVTVTVIG